MKRIGDIYYKEEDGVLLPTLNLTKSTREHTWITQEQIALEYPEAIDMMAHVLFSHHGGKKKTPIYPEKAREFVRSLLFFLNHDGHLSWKQFDSIFFLFDKNATKEGTTRRKKGNLIAAKRGSISFVGRVTHISSDDIWWDTNTDRGFDRLYRHIFGHEPTFEENMDEEGPMDTNYRDDGSRYFSLPTEESLRKQGIDAMMSDSDRAAARSFFSHGGNWG